MPANDKFIKKLNTAQEQTVQRKHFSPRVPLQLKYVYEEPDGWPLTRPATPAEWAHVLKVMIMRRVPKMAPIHRTKLIRYVSSDLESASATGKIYVDGNFNGMRSVRLEVDRMCARDKTLRFAPSIDDPDELGPAPAVYRTERAGPWLSRVPKTVEVVVNFLPVANLLDLMVQALNDADLQVPDSDRDGSYLGA